MFLIVEFSASFFFTTPLRCRTRPVSGPNHKGDAVVSVVSVVAMVFLLYQVPLVRFYFWCIFVFLLFRNIPKYQIFLTTINFHMFIFTQQE